MFDIIKGEFNVTKIPSSVKRPCLRNYSKRESPAILFAMKRIDGKALALEIRQEVAANIRASNIHPGLGVLLVGDDPASHLYVALKEKAAKEVGIETQILRLPATTSDDELRKIIEEWNAEKSIDAILVQLPLPQGHDTDRIVAAIDPQKDVDGFHPKNTQALLEGTATIFPPVHESILRLIGATDIQIRSSKAVILANSTIFAEPLEHLLKMTGCGVQVMFMNEGIDQNLLREADIIVIAIGRPYFLNRSLVKDGVCIIDVGTNRVNDKVVGDVDTEEFTNVPGWLSPVPGGVGPLTVALLLKNVFELAKRYRQ
jgi:methylenetetrahydrofolate dehydrogenase (NADP+)/methenyltetrahydrofolate cyclohydrolase